LTGLVIAVEGLFDLRVIGKTSERVVEPARRFEGRNMRLNYRIVIG
jgi:hypothetical protein